MTDGVSEPAALIVAEQVRVEDANVVEVVITGVRTVAPHRLHYLLNRQSGGVARDDEDTEVRIGSRDDVEVVGEIGVRDVSLH